MNDIVPNNMAALQRWETDGGTGAPLSGPSPKRAGPDIDRHMLQSLGAAVVGQWSELPTYIQRTLFRLAAGSTPYRGGRRARVARFLHDNKSNPKLR